MADYTYQELMRMQNDAIKRVEDMQRRARKTAGFSEENENEKISPSARAAKPENIVSIKLNKKTSFFISSPLSRKRVI